MPYGDVGRCGVFSVIGKLLGITETRAAAGEDDFLRAGFYAACRGR